MNDEPAIRLKFDEGEDFIATPHNSELYSFAGEMASRSHVFLTRERDGHRMIGSWIFSFSNVFPRLSQFLIDNYYPVHLNLQEVTSTDEEAYQTAISQIAERDTIGDFLPDDWV